MGFINMGTSGVLERQSEFKKHLGSFVQRRAGLAGKGLREKDEGSGTGLSVLQSKEYLVLRCLWHQMSCSSPFCSAVCGKVLIFLSFTGSKKGVL